MLCKPCHDIRPEGKSTHEDTALANVIKGANMREDPSIVSTVHPSNGTRPYLREDGTYNVILVVLCGYLEEDDGV